MPGKWTILIYLDADNNLEGAGVGDVQEMVNRAQAAGGYGANNKVYVLMDRIPGYSSQVMPNTFANFDGARLFEVVTGTGILTPRSPGAAGQFLQPNMPNNDGTDEINMGDSTILEKFIKWGLAQAVTNNSDYVFLDLWDHGAGWGGNAYGGNAVAWDDTNGHDALTINEIRTAISNAHAASTSGSKRVTILGFDACYMGMAEMAFAFKNLARIVIGSEEVEPGDGWDYANWLPSGDISPTDLAAKVVTSYEAFYATSGGNVTLAAYDLSKTASLQGALDSFVSALGASDASLVSAARSQAQIYNNNFSVDLYHFAHLMNRPESNGVKTAVSNMLIRETHTAGGRVGKSFGMSIYFPSSSSAYDTTYGYTLLAQSTKWDEFVSGKIVSYQLVSLEPGDATCGTELNNAPKTANSIATGGGLIAMPCTGYIYTPTDTDFYNFSIPNASLPINSSDTGKTITISLAYIPTGSDFYVYVYAPFYSPSSAIAVGAGSNTTFTIELATGKVTFASPNLGTCDPSNASNTLHQSGFCYGQGLVAGGGLAHNIYVVVRGSNGAYNQIAKYSLSVSVSGITVAAPVAID